MSSENFLYQVEGIGALPDASLYTDRYWAVPTGDSTYQCTTYKSDGSNWVYVNGCITYGPGLPYATVESLPENCVAIDPYGDLQKKISGTMYQLSSKRGDVVLGDSLSTNVGYGSWWDYLCINSFGMFERNKNSAIGGNTIQQMISRFVTDVVAYNPERVHILAGTNNLSEEIPVIVSRLSGLIELAKSYGITVLLYSVPPNGNNPSKPVPLNNEYEILAAQKGIEFRRIWEPFSLPDYSAYISGFSEDGVHPKVFNHKLIGTYVASLFNVQTASRNLFKTGFPTIYLDGLFNSLANSSGTGYTISTFTSDIGKTAKIEYSGITAWTTGLLTKVVSANPVAVGQKLIFAARVKLYNATDNFRLQLRAGNGIAPTGVFGETVGGGFDGVIVSPMSCSGSITSATGLYGYANSFDGLPASGTIEVSQAQIHAVNY